MKRTNCAELPQLAMPFTFLATEATVTRRRRELCSTVDTPLLIRFQHDVADALVELRQLREYVAQHMQIPSRANC